MMRASTALVSGWRKGPGISPTGKHIRALPRRGRDTDHSCRIFAGMRSKCLWAMHKISMNRRQIFVVHSLSQARAAISAAAARDSAVTLLSAPGAAAYAGAAWFSAVVKTARESQPRVDVLAILDCGARADLVQAAFR